MVKIERAKAKGIVWKEKIRKDKSNRKYWSKLKKEIKERIETFRS